MNARHPFHPLQEVHGHSIEQAGVAWLAGQAHMQLVQVILAGICSLTPQDLARLCQPNCGLHTAGRLECHVNGVGVPTPP